MRNFSGEFRFVFAAVGALAAWRERRVIVTVDGFDDEPNQYARGRADGLP